MEVDHRESHKQRNNIFQEAIEKNERAEIDRGTMLLAETSRLKDGNRKHFARVKNSKKREINLTRDAKHDALLNVEQLQCELVDPRNVHDGLLVKYSHSTVTTERGISDMR